MRRGMLMLSSLAIFHAVCLASETEALQHGSRVRLTAPGLGLRQMTGVLVDLSSDSIRIHPDGRAADLTLARQQLGRLEISHGMKRHILKSAGLGLLIGGGLGVLLGSASEPGFGGKSTSIYLGSLLFGGAGLVVGTGVGLIRAEAWTRVPVEALPMALE